MAEEKCSRVGLGVVVMCFNPSAGAWRPREARLRCEEDDAPDAASRCERATAEVCVRASADLSCPRLDSARLGQTGGRLLSRRMRRQLSNARGGADCLTGA